MIPEYPTDKTMQTAPEFDACNWIAANTRGGHVLTDAATKAVSDFTLMWNLFEDVICWRNANPNVFEEFVKNIDQGQIDADILAELDECLLFWKTRYKTPDGFAIRFFNLHFRKADKQALVEDVLEEREQGIKDRLLALIIITYRIRNNLFHGLKTIEMLNDQNHNLNNASRCLSLMLKLQAQNSLFHPQPINLQQ